MEVDRLDVLLQNGVKALAFSEIGMNTLPGRSHSVEVDEESNLLDVLSQYLLFLDPQSIEVLDFELFLILQ
jgi:hypothetical protein